MNFFLIKTIFKKNKTIVVLLIDEWGFLHKILSVCSQGIKCMILRISCVLSNFFQTMRTSPIL